MPEIKETTYLKDLWNEAEAQKMSGDQLALLRYRSNLLGADLRITNFGGGNTSSKMELPDPVTGRTVRVLAGGFTTNFIWCVILNIRNRTGYQYFESDIRGKVPVRGEEHILETVTDAPAEEMAVAVAVAQDAAARAPLANYLFSALAGTTWYLQFFFYSMGETQIGRYKFSSWTLHMASIIIFSTLWGIALKEWMGAGGRTRLLVAFTLLVLVSSTVVVGYGNYVGRSSQ